MRFCPSALFELHGNSNVEKCRKCGKEYLRDFTVVGTFHSTGRICDNPSCGGPLMDTIINFGENLPQGKDFCTHGVSHVVMCGSRVQRPWKRATSIPTKQTCALPWAPVSPSLLLQKSLKYDNCFFFFVEVLEFLCAECGRVQAGAAGDSEPAEHTSGRVGYSQSPCQM